MRYLLFIALFSLTLIGYSQSGKITVRKSKNDLIGKSLLLNDLRGYKSGSINFTSRTKATVTLELNIKNPVIKFKFQDRVPLKETLNCSYSIINDTLLLLKHKNYQDTCYYNYINSSNNLVQLKNTLHGIISQEDFAICYHFDSILYSQTYNKSISDTKFTYNIEFDSLYKDVVDKKLKKELQEKLNKEIEKYTNNISYNYYKGKYLIDKNKLNLYLNDVNFAYSIIQKSNTSFKLKSNYLLDGSKPLSSLYTHNNYSDLHIMYGIAYIKYLNPSVKRYNNDTEEQQILKTDTFNIKYINEYEAILFNQTDTLSLWQNNNFANVRVNNALGGYYQTHYKSLNGNKIPFKKFLFTTKNAVEVNENYSIISNSKWDYKITDSVLYLYNETDTLIDELKNSWESFSFTYKNNEPFIFGTYHYKKTKGKHHFIILFENNRGIKFTSNTFDYKEAREILINKLNTKQKKINYRAFTFSSSKEFLWLNYEDGKYQKLSFFNYNKAIREETKEQTNNYYLIE